MNSKLIVKCLESVLEEVGLEFGVREEDIPDFVEMVIEHLEYRLDSYEDPIKDEDVEGELNFD